MSSTFGGLNTMLSGLNAQQIALNTIGQNVSNSSTDGYSRQITSITATTPETMQGTNGTIQVGTGAGVTSITRARDALVDKQFWQQTSALNYNQTTQSNLTKVESAFGEPSDTGIQSVLNTFWSSLQTLSTNASDVGDRTTVREQGVALVNSIQNSAKQLKSMVTDINSTIDMNVASVNTDTAEIATLNTQIKTIEAGGTDHANDLRDQRDAVVDKLSALIDVRVTEQTDGTYSIQSGNVSLVSGAISQKLTTSTSTGGVATDPDYGYPVENVSLAGNYQPVTFASGQIKSLIDMRDSTQTGVKGYLNNLSTMSQFLLQGFNQVNRSGYGTDNSTGNNFFGAGGNTNPDYTSAAVSGNFTKNDWITNLQVNPDLFDATDGVAKIAAKTAGDSIGVTQSNTTGGTAAVFAAGTYTNGSTPTNVVVKATSVTAGTIDNIQYSTDGGITYNGTNIPVNANGSYSLSINGLAVTMNLNTNATNATNDTYSYTLDDNSADSSLAVTQTNALGGTGTITGVTGTYTNGDTATPVMVEPFDSTANSIDATTGQIDEIKYSTDGGTTWSTTATQLNADGTFSIPVNGVTVKLQIGTSTSNTATDQYNFTISKGNVASGDNAILLGNRLTVDTSATLGNATLNDYYSSVISDLGVQSQNANNDTDNQQSLVDQVTTLRASVSGVNMDEEMTNMITYQKAYEAAARMITTMDDMLDKLINGTGSAG